MKKATQDKKTDKEKKSAPAKSEKVKTPAAKKATAKPEKAKKTVTAKKTAADEKKVKKVADEKAKNTVKAAEKKPAVKNALEKKSAPKTKATKAKEEFIDDIKIDDTVAVTEGGATRSGKFDIRRAKDGRFFFNLYASNYAVIAYSQMYSSTQSTLTGIKSVMANAEKAPIEDTTLKKAVSLPFPKWEIYIDRAGEYRFRLYASNGSCVCHSHGYSTKATCKGGIESIIRFAKESNIDKSYLKVKADK